MTTLGAEGGPLVQTPADREAPRKAQPRRVRPVVVRAQPGPDAEEQAQLSTRSAAAQLGPRLVSRLQAQAGNSAVSRLVLQRRDLSSPSADPKFRALTSDVRGKQKRLAAHPPAKGEAEKAAKAAKAPPDDKQAQGKAAQAEKMNAAKPGEFNKAAFIAAVNDAIAKQAPKNLDEADNFGESGKADAVKGQVAGQGQRRQEGLGRRRSRRPRRRPPDTSKVKDKPVTPLAPDQPPGTPGDAEPGAGGAGQGAAGGTPTSRPGPSRSTARWPTPQVTEEQLAKSNEPEFTGALDAKKEGEAALRDRAGPDPGAVRRRPSARRRPTRPPAGAPSDGSMADDAQGARGQPSRAASRRPRSADEAEAGQGRRRPCRRSSTPPRPTSRTSSPGSTQGRRRSSTPGRRRPATPSPPSTSGRWTRTRTGATPACGARAAGSRTSSRACRRRPTRSSSRPAGYVDRMQQVIASVADIIAAELNRAKARIAEGRDAAPGRGRRSCPKDLQAIGKQAAGDSPASSTS